MDKISITSKILKIYNKEQHPTEKEIIAFISALGNIGNDNVVDIILKTYDESNKTSGIRIATITALSRCCD
ncbi:hypothetical protein E2566_17655 [Pectobacterium punjabense]|uniref:HEAT repeat domain-containing protein n=1 Tax=Pectobacterium punjabense TaxID=2108399 RepID=A0ABX6L5K6_9GAMM|nr:hypothetical protein [Pectobacterium punjabense]MBS4430534.1 hypothetical protein [Pectobacterium punjabense]QJA21599.1 hypothetical protein E2566_17655 [Pectobacterium punjabense]